MVEFAVVAFCISLGIALFVSLPYFVKFVLYYLYRPKLKIFFPPPPIAYTLSWNVLAADASGVENTPLTINYGKGKPLKLEIEFRLNKPWHFKPGGERHFVEQGLSGYPDGAGFWYKTRVSHLTQYGLFAIVFPFQPQPEQCTIQITVYPKAHLADFGFPRYFGETDLKAITTTFKIIP